MGANPHANGGLLLRDLELPDFRDYAVDVPGAGADLQRGDARARRLPARRHAAQPGPRNFRLFGPDETASNRLGAVLRGDRPRRGWPSDRARRRPPRARRPRHGGAERAPLPGLARGLPADRPPRALQLLRGVHPHRRLDVQPARQVAEGHARRSRGGGRSRRSTTCSRSHVWRQDHNGFSHQDPGFIDHVVNKKAEIVRVYLPPDANCLLSVADHCLRSRDYVNVIVAGKQPALDYLDDGRGDRALHARHRHLGRGRATTTATSPTSCWPARATSRRSRRSPPRRCCASTCPSCACAWSTSST